MDLSAGATLEARQVSFRFGGRAVLDRASFAVRFGEIAGGRVVADGPPEKVLSPEAILSIYGVRVEVLRTAAGMAVLSPLGAAPERR